MNFKIDKQLILEAIQLLEEWGRPIGHPAHKDSPGADIERARIKDRINAPRQIRTSLDRRKETITLPSSGNTDPGGTPSTNGHQTFDNPIYHKENRRIDELKNHYTGMAMKESLTDAPGDGPDYSKPKTNQGIRNDHNSGVKLATIVGGNDTPRQPRQVG